MVYSKGLSNIIRIRLAQKDDAVDEPANSEKSASKQIYDAHANFSFVEFMCAEVAQEQAQEERYPLILSSNAKHCRIHRRLTIGLRVRLLTVGLCIGLRLAVRLGLTAWLGLTVWLRLAVGLGLGIRLRLYIHRLLRIINCRTAVIAPHLAGSHRRTALRADRFHRFSLLSFL